MATSGAMTTSNPRIQYTITVTQNSQSVANNTSNVTVNVFFYRTNTGYTSYGTGTVYCKIDGTTYTAGVVPSQKITNSGITLFSKTLNITHNADGKKDLTCSAWISHDVVSSSEQSYTQTLTTIPRASTPTFSASSVDFGSSITITTNRASSSFTHTLSYKVEESGATGTIASSVGASTSWTIPTSLIGGFTNSKSSIITVTCVTYNGSTNIGTKTASFTANIPASVPTLNVSSINIGSSVTITTNRANSSLTHAIKYNFGSLSNQTSGISNSSTAGASTTFTPPTSLYAEVPSATYGTCTISVTTKNGTATVGTKTINLRLNVPSDIKPSISSVSISDNDSGIARKFGAFIQRKSKLKVAFTWTAGSGSSLSTKTAVINGKSYTSNSFTTGVLNTSGAGSSTNTNNRLVITAKDTRGRSAESISDFTVLEYDTPSISNFEVKRCNAQGEEDGSGEYAIFSVDASIYALNNKNDKSFKLSYKKTTESEWTDFIIESSTYSVIIEDSILTSGKDLIPIDTDSSYNFRFTVADYFGEISQLKFLSTGATILDIYADGSGMATGKVAEHPNTFDIGNKKTYLSTNTYLGGEERTNDEKNLFIQSTGEGTYKHNCKLYGGNSESASSIGLWDVEIGQLIFRYVSHLSELQFGGNVDLKHNGRKLESVVEIVKGNKNGLVRFANGLLIQWGNVSVIPVANTPTTVTITFPRAYIQPPCIKVSSTTVVMGTTVLGVAHSGTTNTGTDLTVTRTNTTATWIDWIAIGFAEEVQ